MFYNNIRYFRFIQLLNPMMGGGGGGFLLLLLLLL